MADSSLIAYDAAHPDLIPVRDPLAVLPYCDGHYRWSHVLFPRASWRYITVLGEPDADIADWEPGCIFTEEGLRTWAERRLGRGHDDLTVYTDRDNFPAAKAAMAGLDWFLFLAAWGENGAPLAPITSYEGMPVRLHQFQNAPGFDRSYIFDPDWLNK